MENFGGFQRKKEEKFVGTLDNKGFVCYTLLRKYMFKMIIEYV